MNSEFKKLRVIVASVFGLGLTVLFLDFTGILHGALGWMAKVQLFPAMVAGNAVVIIFVVAATLLVGRLYCSVVCPLGIFQDVISFSAKKMARKPRRFSFSPEKPWLRLGVLGCFIAAFLLGASGLVALLEPYSAFGRIVAHFFAPLVKGLNNGLASLAVRIDSYSFYSVEVWLKTASSLIVAGGTLLVIVWMAARHGRLYCNTVCPVGTLLGLFSKFSWFQIRMDITKCNHCGLCASACKAGCLDAKTGKVDASRCVVCFNCIGKCRQNAITFGKTMKTAAESTVPTPAGPPPPHEPRQPTMSRREVLAMSVAVVASTALQSQAASVDGGLAIIADKQTPKRETPILPPGAQTALNFSAKCTACHLCVSACPNHVLTPSSDLRTFMQPHLTYEKGYCRPECTTCSSVCPTGAIQPISIAEKSSTQIGHAVWNEKNCIVLTDGVTCSTCARKCPSGAIFMIERSDGVQTPSVNLEVCIGCGACEHLCPARPVSAIVVEGHVAHRTL